MATRIASSSTGERRIHRIMKEFKEAELKSSSGATVTNRRQAVAIALNEARSEGAKIPPSNALKP